MGMYDLVIKCLDIVKLEALIALETSFIKLFKDGRTG